MIASPLQSSELENTGFAQTRPKGAKRGAAQSHPKLLEARTQHRIRAPVARALAACLRQLQVTLFEKEHSKHTPSHARWLVLLELGPNGVHISWGQLPASGSQKMRWIAWISLRFGLAAHVTAQSDLQPASSLACHKLLHEV